MWFGTRGRRFKSSLPDHSFQSLIIDFWLAAYSGVGNFEAVRASKITSPSAANRANGNSLQVLSK